MKTYIVKHKNLLNRDSVDEVVFKRRTELGISDCVEVILLKNHLKRINELNETILDLREKNNMKNKIFICDECKKECFEKDGDFFDDVFYCHDCIRKNDIKGMEN